jgi:hypothetical protein
VSELGDFLAGIDKIRLRQSRAIARLVDRQRAAIEAGTAQADEAGYEFAVAIVAAATDRMPAEIEEMEGSLIELGPALPRIMALAGFASGEAGPAAGAGPSGTGSGASMAPSPPAAATRRRKSAR